MCTDMELNAESVEYQQKLIKAEKAQAEKVDVKPPPSSHSTTSERNFSRSSNRSQEEETRSVLRNSRSSVRQRSKNSSKT
jgi:hypothetical protein